MLQKSGADRIAVGRLMFDRFAHGPQGRVDQVGVQEEVLELAARKDLRRSAACLVKSLDLRLSLIVAVEQESHSHWRLTRGVDDLLKEPEGEFGLAPLAIEHRRGHR